MREATIVRHRVAVTGLGIVSPLGLDVTEVHQALRLGRSGLRAMSEWSRYGLKSLVVGAVPDVAEKRRQSHIPKKLALGMSEAGIWSSLAAIDAVRDARLEPEELQDQRTACIVGSGVGDVLSIYEQARLYYANKIRRSHPFGVIRGMSSSASAAVANLFKIHGRSYSLSSACATSAHNIGHAFELIRAGVIDCALAGGCEDINELIGASFHALRMALSTGYNQTPARASRPYDLDRDGFVLSGGAGILVLERLDRARARGVPVRAEILGFGANSDGHDLVLPDPEGRQVGLCMQLALHDAGVEPGSIDYVNTHGTSTVVGDAAEVAGMRRVFGDRLPRFGSTKSMTGHGIGAAGAHELIYSIVMIENDFIAPSINIDNLDPAFEGLPVVRETVTPGPRRVLSNNFGFGGTNAATLVGRYDG